MNISQELDDVLRDINARYPSPAVVTIGNIVDFLGVNRRVATEEMREIGKPVGRNWYAHKTAFARYLIAQNKRQNTQFIFSRLYSSYNACNSQPGNH